MNTSSKDYEDLQEESRRHGWITDTFPINLVCKNLINFTSTSEQNYKDDSRSDNGYIFMDHASPHCEWEPTKTA